MRQHTWLVLALALACVLLARPSSAQTPAGPSDPPLRRWLELQNFMLYTRYRFIENSAGVVTANQHQYKDTLRFRVNVDAKRWFTLNVGAFSGSSFSSTWDNTGIGTGDPDFHDQYVKQFFVAVAPVSGVEGQFGGIYVVRGENTEYLTYDEDGYLVGERLTIRRPRTLYLDEITVTRAMLGFLNTPNVFKRWDGLTEPNYTQLLVSKRFSSAVAASLDYTTYAGADTIRAAMSLRFKPSSPLTALRYEQYGRITAHPAAGFAVTGERPVTKWVRLQAGYATVDEFYGNLNADRILRGRRVFAIANVPIVGGLSVQTFVTRAFDAPYTISNRTRFDFMLQYDVLSSLRKTGVF